MFKQYIQAVAAIDIQPEIMRSNYSGETYIVTDNYFQLTQQIRLDYTDNKTREPITRKDITFKYIFLFSISVLN